MAFTSSCPWSSTSRNPRVDTSRVISLLVKIFRESFSWILCCFLHVVVWPVRPVMSGGTVTVLRLVRAMRLW